MYEKVLELKEELKSVVIENVHGLKEEVKNVKTRLEGLEQELARMKAVKGGAYMEKHENVEQKQLFFEFLRKGITPETKALVSDSATSEVLVPPDIYAAIIQTLPKVNFIRPLIASVQVKGDRLRVRDISDVTVGWGELETGASITESTPYVSQKEIHVHDLYGLVKIGENLLADSDVALETLIVQLFSKAIANAERQAFLIGDGTTRPEGIFTTNNYTVYETEGATISYDDIITLYFELPEQYRSNAVWLVAKAAAKTLKKLKDNTGNYIWDRDISVSPSGTILGRPVYIVDEIDFAPAGTRVVAFGDFKAGYIALDKPMITIQRLNELYATQGLVGFKVHYRVGGGVLDRNAVKLLAIKM